MTASVDNHIDYVQMSAWMNETASATWLDLT